MVRVCNIVSVSTLGAQNGYETVSVLPGCAGSAAAAAAGSVWTLGVRRISGLRWIAPFCKLANPALAFGPCAGFLSCIP